MEYTELSVDVSSLSEELKDWIMAELSVADFESIMEEENQIKAYIPSQSFEDGNLEALKKLLESNHLEMKVKQIPFQNWNSEWEKNYDPVVIQDRVHIRADFHPKLPDMEHELLINPKMSFGTGHHQTTELMILYCLDTDFNQKRVLDMGTGTGVLAILAAKKGAKSIDAFDIDENSVENARENVRLNRCAHIQVERGEANFLRSEEYDFILANINKNVLIHDMSYYARSLRAGGILIISGFFLSDAQDLIDEANRHRLTYRNHKCKNKWSAISFQKK